MLIELTLICVLAQSPQRQVATTPPPDHQVALVFSDTDPSQAVFIRLNDARRLHRALSTGGKLPRRVRVTLADGSTGTFRELQRTKNDARVLAALVAALGTVPDERRVAPFVNDPARLDWEIRRGVTLPTQEPKPIRRRRHQRGH
jgi:hypothetical protein